MDGQRDPDGERVPGRLRKPGYIPPVPTGAPAGGHDPAVPVSGPPWDADEPYRRPSPGRGATDPAAPDPADDGPGGRAVVLDFALGEARRARTAAAGGPGPAEPPVGGPRSADRPPAAPEDQPEPPASGWGIPAAPGGTPPSWDAYATTGGSWRSGGPEVEPDHPAAADRYAAGQGWAGADRPAVDWSDTGGDDDRWGSGRPDSGWAESDPDDGWAAPRRGRDGWGDGEDSWAGPVARTDEGWDAARPRSGPPAAGNRDRALRMLRLAVLLLLTALTAIMELPTLRLLVDAAASDPVPARGVVSGTLLALGLPVFAAGLYGLATSVETYTERGRDWPRLPVGCLAVGLVLFVAAAIAAR